MGIAQAKGDFILFLNNDTEVENDFLEPLIDCFRKDPTLGMVSPKIIYFDNGLVQYAGAKRISPLTGRGKRLGNLQEDDGRFDQSSYTDLGFGAAMIVPKKVIEEIGLMPEQYFLYYEEHDWCQMIKRAGYQIYFEPRSKVYHKESVTVGSNSPLKVHYLHRNRLLYIKRNVFGVQRFLAFSFFFLLTLPKNSIKFLLADILLFKALWKGVFSFFYLNKSL